ncbi:MAG: hypothetical protein Q9183_007575, partial [Haloplaca sp. 2 TL-2023]
MQSPASSPLLKDMCPSFRDHANSSDHMEAGRGSSPQSSIHEIYAFIALSLDKAFRGDYKRMEEYLLEVWRENNMRDLECGFSTQRTLPLTGAQLETLCRKTEAIRQNILGDVKQQQDFLAEEQRDDALKVRFEKLLKQECVGISEQALQLLKDYHHYKRSQASSTIEKDIPQKEDHGSVFSSLFGRNAPWRDNIQPKDLEALKSATRDTSRAIQMSASNENDREPKYWLNDMCGPCT